MPEHDGVDNRYVKNREYGDETTHDGEEQELVAPHVVKPLGEVLLRAGLHHEEGTTHVNHLPGEEQREPGKAGESGSASTEDGCAAVVEAFVTAGTEIAITETEHDDREGRETEGGDPETVDEHVDQDFNGENTTLELNICQYIGLVETVARKLTL